MNWFPKSTPRDVDGGLTARSRRGDIGEKWWSRKFVDVLESYGRSNRLQRGKRYARRGQVLNIEVTPGTVEAPVQGSRSSPYTVTIGGDALDNEQWEKVIGAMAERAAFTARLLAGEMPADIEEAFEEADATLFPDRLRDMHTTCTCPDSANPCKHIAAVLYILAEKFDDDPFLILRWRGRSREQLLDELRALRSDAAEFDQETLREPLAHSIKTFWTAEDELPPRSPDLRSNDRAISGLERLGDPPHELADVPKRLRPLYDLLTTDEATD